MDCLSGRKTTGHMTGDILVNGYPKKQRTFCRIAGYVEQVGSCSPQEDASMWVGRGVKGLKAVMVGVLLLTCACQMDVHSPHSTVREALEFSAVLRLPYHKVRELRSPGPGHLL